MTMTDPQPVDPAIVAQVSEMFHSGCAHDVIIARMRALGLDKIECIKLVREFAGVTLGRAKDIVHLSPAWADRYESDEAFHDEAEAAFLQIMKEEETTAA